MGKKRKLASGRSSAVCSTCELIHPSASSKPRRSNDAAVESVTESKTSKREKRIAKRKLRKEMDILRFCGVVAYNGTNYHGFQRQTYHGVWNVPTIQLRLEEAFSKVLGVLKSDESLVGASEEYVFPCASVSAIGKIYGRSTPIVVTGASRTDAGVHAAGQVFHVDIPTSLVESSVHYESVHFQSFCEETMKSLNKELMNEEIQIKRMKNIDRSFDTSRESAGKRYKYILYDGKVPPDRNLYCNRFLDIYNDSIRKYHPDKLTLLNVQKMDECAQGLAGGIERDFRAFTRSAKRCAKSEPGPARTRRILWKCNVRRINPGKEMADEGIQGSQDGSFIEIEVEGNGFLYLMVRCIVTALVEVGKGKTSPKYVVAKTENLGLEFDPASAYRPALPIGLSLEQVFYLNKSILGPEAIPSWAPHC